MNTHIPFTSCYTCKPGAPYPSGGSARVHLQLSGYDDRHGEKWHLPSPPCSSFTLLYCEVGASLSRRTHSSSSLPPELLLFQLGERERMTQGSRTLHEIPPSLHAGRLNHSETSITSAGRVGGRAEPVFDGLQLRLTLSPDSFLGLTVSHTHIFFYAKVEGSIKQVNYTKRLYT